MEATPITEFLKSPLTGRTNILLETTLDCQKIIQAYQQDYGDAIALAPYFSDLDQVKIYRCLDTGYRFYYPFELAADSDFYARLQTSGSYYSLRLEHQIATQFFRPSESVLEIGCGIGLFLQQLQQKGLICTGLELNQQAVQTACAQGLHVINQEIGEHAENHAESYDIVCFFQVLEHIPQVRPFIQAALAVLKPGGKLIVGVPNNNPFLFEHDCYHALNLPPHHMGLWDTQSLTSLQDVFNLQLDHLLVEPLQFQDYDHYFRLQAEHLAAQSWFLGQISKFVWLQLRPTRIRLWLQAVMGRSREGRNLLAVYTKT
ncbi:hypothetical protein BST81_10015 [Leptolyngbya sp. 'hensonii']|uniref:class I SAM-dependent methyltransferase n=1 Tax=Leptolyngbya sp. 'hensonii' TaxID=1922337 RepID=UPI00094F53D2|nr:methyltransferase domain-containing protein [Leptolyngbya sp. 'hensonii']OLP18612.1 hypothetical protein BST81_10015 [Leptolyngbya sp. 'hensonii']